MILHCLYTYIYLIYIYISRTCTCRKVQLALAMLLWKQLSHHRGNTAWPPRLFQLPVIMALNFTCSNVILSGDSMGTQWIHGPGWNHRGILKFNPSHLNPLPTGSGGGEGRILKNHLSCTVRNDVHHAKWNLSIRTARIPLRSMMQIVIPASWYDMYCGFAIHYIVKEELWSWNKHWTQN